MNALNTKGKNLVLASPLKQNLNKIKNWLGAPELIMAPITYAHLNQLTYARTTRKLIMASIDQSIISCICTKLAKMLKNSWTCKKRGKITLTRE